MDKRKYNIFKKEDVKTYLKADSKMNRVLGVRDLIALGVGAVIGTGIFILPGHEAQQNAGPAVAIAFVLAAVISGLAGLAYSEFSAAMPVAGSAYSFGNVIYGEIVGFSLGWALIAEYFLAVSAIATGFAAYFNNNLLTAVGIHLPKALQTGPLSGGVVNITAVIIILVVGLLISRGLHTSKNVENFAVVLKVAIILLFIIVGFFFVKSQNYVPFYPEEFHRGVFGIGGITAAAASVFFAFIGFDALAAQSAEVKDPEKNMSRGIMGTVLVSAVLYTLFAIVLVGVVNYKKLGVDDPAAFALQAVGHAGWAKLITAGALIGMFTAIMAMLNASSRLVYSIGRDGLLPKSLGKINEEKEVPTNAIIVATIVAAFFAGMVPLNDLAALINAGTLIAFTLISFGIIPLRRRKDLKHNGYKMPLYPVLPILSGMLSVYFLFELPNQTKIAIVIWLIIGIIFYFIYGLRHSKLQNK